VESTYRPGKKDIVAIDGMAVTLPKTQRHNCKKFNDKTVGGGVVRSYMVTAVRGVCPVKVLKIVQGAWHDSVIMHGIALIARGPLYLMDRGFYCYELMEQWVADKVRFILRIKERSFSHEALRTVGNPRRHGALRILLDVVARLGKADGKHRPVVRLVIALLPDGEKLILATNQYRWTAGTRRLRLTQTHPSGSGWPACLGVRARRGIHGCSVIWTLRLAEQRKTKSWPVWRQAAMANWSSNSRSATWVTRRPGSRGARPRT
jgi:hypothetical protein